VKFTYDPESDAAYLEFRRVPVEETEEIAPGVMIDLAADGRPVGLELLNASKLLENPLLSIQLELLTRNGTVGPRRSA
jgi:uncharacterized protein YuzE